MDALEVSCPDCHQRKNQPCVYIQPKAPHGTAAWVDQIERAGQPTKRPHTRRYEKAHLKEQVRKIREREAKYAAQNAATRTRAEVLAANARAVQDEQWALIAWLQKHANVLIGDA
jgi:hypothetical protein